jgi:Transposase DDE domain group 1
MPLLGGKIGLATVQITTTSEGISEVQPSHRVSSVFDDPNLMSSAGLVPVLRLADSAGFSELLAEHLSVSSPNAAAKAGCVISGMLAGADSIDRLDLLRHGAMRKVFTGVRAPSTLGTYLRSFTHGHVQQLDAVGGRLLAGLATRVPGLLDGGQEPEGIAFVDVDDTIREVHGYAKQGAAFGYSGVRGLNAQLAIVSAPTAAPVIARARLRSGNTPSHRGSGRLLTQALKTARAAGVQGMILVRADSAYYTHAFVAAALRAKAWFSVTARMNAQVTATISSIGEEAWTPIRYPNAVWEETEPGVGHWVSDAEVAEVAVTVFTSRRKADHVTCRLVVRRVKRLQPLASDGTKQGELFASHRHHAFITNSTLTTVEADARHRDHAIIEQVIAELKQGPIAHLPSGSYAANAAWLAHAVIAFNLARAAGVLASSRHAKARWATLRTQLINVPARVATTARRLVLHLPVNWPWADAWSVLDERAVGPPHPRAA